MIVESSRTPATAYRCDRLDSGDYYLELIPQGNVVRLVDLEGNQAADTLFYSAEAPAERYSVTDTIR